MKIQFFPKALKGNLKNEVLKAVFAAGYANVIQFEFFSDYLTEIIV